MRTVQNSPISFRKEKVNIRLKKDFYRNKWKYILMLPIVVYFILFCYKPMYGVVIAFKNYKPAQGIAESKWVGVKYFAEFFNDYYFARVIRNTFVLSLNSILWGFPAPVLLALLLNELMNETFKRTVQTIVYIPHFISMVIICSIIRQFSLSDGVFNDVGAFFGATRVPLLQKPSYFNSIYVISGVWQETGWGCIIYLAALTSIDPQLYEAAEIDGAGRLRQTWHVTLPGILPTVVMMLILRMGGVLNVGFEKILLLYNETIYETSDVISTYVYRKGIIDANFSYSSAVGLFNSIINIVFLLTTNYISKRTTEVGLF